MRYLRDCEKKNIYEMDKLVWLFIKYLNSIKKNICLVLIMNIILFFVLYIYQYEFKNIAIILSVYSIILTSLLMCMYLLCKVYRNIEKDKIGCIDIEMVNKREELDKNNMDKYYVTVNINGENKEIEYNGKDFENLKIGEEMVLIEYMFFNKQAYLCYSYNEINKM